MTNTPPSPCCQSFPWIGYLFFVVVLVGTFVLGILVVQVTQRRAEAVKRNIIFPIPPAEMDATVWGKNFPRQYDSWMRTQLETPATKYGGSNTRDYLRGKPGYVVLFAGIGFSKEYIQGR